MDCRPQSSQHSDLINLLRKSADTLLESTLIMNVAANCSEGMARDLWRMTEWSQQF
jgi:hypothetical protein